jgi:hypothetical protein
MHSVLVITIYSPRPGNRKGHAKDPGAAARLVLGQELVRRGPPSRLRARVWRLGCDGLRGPVEFYEPASRKATPASD